MTDVLEDKATEMLNSLTQSLTEGPQSLLELYTTLLLQNRNNPEALKELNETARLFISKIHDLTRILSDSTRVLETYLSYKISKRHEEATKRQEEMTKVLLRHNRILAFSTTFLALSTFGLVLVTVLLHI